MSMLFPQRLRQLRQQKKLRQRDVANKLGITVSAYGYYEQGKREASYATLEKLADYFDVSVDYLLGREDDPKRPDHSGNNGVLGERIRAGRKSKRLSQEELAKRVSTTKGTISNYENGYSSPSNEMLLKLARELNTTTDYLLGRTDIPSELKDSDANEINKLYDPEDPYWQKAIEIYKELQQGKKPAVAGLDILTILNLPEEERKQFIKGLKRIIETMEEDLNLSDDPSDH